MKPLDVSNSTLLKISVIALLLVLLWSWHAYFHAEATLAWIRQQELTQGQSMDAIVFDMGLLVGMVFGGVLFGMARPFLRDALGALYRRRQGGRCNSD